MLTVNHLITLLIIFFISVVIGGIIRVAYNSDKDSNLLVRLKSLFVLQIIMPLTVPIYLKKNRNKIIGLVEKDVQLSEERRERLLGILRDDTRFEKLLKYSRYGYFMNFKEFLDRNIENLNFYKKENGKELNLNTISTFKGLLNPFILNNLIKQPNYLENIYKEIH